MASAWSEGQLGASPLPRSPRVTDELGAALSACATAEAALMRERARASERIEAAAISALDLLGSHAQTPQDRAALARLLREDSRWGGDSLARIPEIRRALAGGDVDRAALMLGRPYTVRGVVEIGDRRGSRIGFPTANLPVPNVMAWPADAVYAGWCTRANGDRHPCAINIGRRPTFYEHTEQSLLEAHLIDFEGDLYGEQIDVSFVQFLRSERKFDGIDQLRAQLTEDIDESRSLLGS